MKTNYKMLWIDDNFRTLRGDKKKFEAYFRDHGITFDAIEIKQTPGIKVVNDEKFIEAVNDIELDVVLVDFNMSGETGADIINHIRKNLHHYHIPILFYSGDGPQKIQEVIFKTNTDKFDISDGIYFCDRNDIFRKAQSILDSLIKKEEKPQRVRGLLMDRVSEIDAQILKILNSKILEQLSEEQIQQIKQEFILDKIEHRKNKTQKLLENFVHMSMQEIIQYIIENPISFDSHMRAELLRNIYRHVDSERGNVLSSFYNDNPSENKKCLSKLRNEYAHQTEKEIANSHTETRCKYIREETQKHLENLSDKQFIQTNVQK